MLLEFPIPNGKFDFFFFPLSKNACNSYKESIALFYIAPKEPIWNNIFQQILARKPKRKMIQNCNEHMSIQFSCSLFEI